MKGDPPHWIAGCNVAIGSNCKCWMCRAVSKWINENHFTTGKQRQVFAEKLLTYLAYRMGYTVNAGDPITLEATIPVA